MFAATKKLFRNTLFRSSLLGAGLFAVSVFFSLYYVYWATISSEINRVDKALLAEISELQALADTTGVAAADREIILRSASGEGLYYLLTPNSASGNLAFQDGTAFTREIVGLIPGDDGDRLTRMNFTYGNNTDEDSDFINRRVRGLSGQLKKDGAQVGVIIVARDVESTMRTADRVKDAIFVSSGIALVLGILSSLFVARRFSNRIEGFNRVATDIRAGHLERRAPRNHSEDELDLLAEHLNSMLDHIDRLMQAMRYAGDSIAHDLRSPLTRLRTRLESAATELGDDPAGDVLFAAAEDASELLTTFDGVLRIARLEAGERRELLVTLDPKPLLDDLAELYEPSCEDVGLILQTNIEEGHQLLADRGLLSQAVSNLMENAIKYNPAGRTISLELRRNKSGRTIIAVSDNGPGIPEADRERVKERFVRLEKSRTAPGSGLGLALVDAVAELHSAKFELDATTPNSINYPGLDARIVFPRFRQPKSPSRSAKKNMAASA